jgi:DNA polymerase-3 subunit delta
MKANLGEITRALDSPPPHIRLFVIFGPDEAGAQALAKRLARSMGADAERIDLDGATLKVDPARLADEAASSSLFGGKRWIRLQPAGEESITAIKALLETPAADNPVIALLGGVRATNALVKLALDNPAALAYQAYLPEEKDAVPVAIALARECGVRLAPEAARVLVQASGNDRSIVAQEVEKLSLYLDAGPDRPVDAGIEHLQAIGAASNDGELGSLVDAVLDGRGDTLAAELARLAMGNVRDIPVLRAVGRRAQLLANMRIEVDGGRNPVQVVEARGKAIFWKDKAAIIRQLTRWDAPRLATLLTRLSQAERAVKAPASLGTLVADHELAEVTRAAARLR